MLCTRKLFSTNRASSSQEEELKGKKDGKEVEETGKNGKEKGNKTKTQNQLQ